LAPPCRAACSGGLVRSAAVGRPREPRRAVRSRRPRHRGERAGRAARPACRCPPASDRFHPRPRTGRAGGRPSRSRQRKHDPDPSTRGLYRVSTGGAGRVCRLSTEARHCPSRVRDLPDAGCAARGGAPCRGGTTPSGPSASREGDTRTDPVAASDAPGIGPCRCCVREQHSLGPGSVSRATPSVKRDVIPPLRTRPA